MCNDSEQLTLTGIKSARMEFGMCLNWLSLEILEYYVCVPPPIPHLSWSGWLIVQMTPLMCFRSQKVLFLNLCGIIFSTSSLTLRILGSETHIYTQSCCCEKVTCFRWHDLSLLGLCIISHVAVSHRFLLHELDSLMQSDTLLPHFKSRDGYLSYLLCGRFSYVQVSPLLTHLLYWMDNVLLMHWLHLIGNSHSTTRLFLGKCEKWWLNYISYSLIPVPVALFWQMLKYLITSHGSLCFVFKMNYLCNIQGIWSHITSSCDSFPQHPCSSVSAHRIRPSVFFPFYLCLCRGQGKTGICIMYWLVACWGGRLCPITCTEHKLVCTGKRMMRG